MISSEVATALKPISVSGASATFMSSASWAAPSSPACVVIVINTASYPPAPSECKVVVAPPAACATAPYSAATSAPAATDPSGPTPAL